ncbi:WD40 repeat domain-containing protein [Candidatus Fermentibacterales bacterium]|nr:WD40 repeat domain-containing protein [Candidatus Fermentibacterales bacterium]
MPRRGLPILAAVAALSSVSAQWPFTDRAVVLVKEIARSADLDPDTMSWSCADLMRWTPVEGDDTDIVYECLSPDSCWRLTMHSVDAEESLGDVVDYRMILWDRRTRMLKLVARNGISAVFSPASTHLLVNGYDGAPILWDLDRGDPVNMGEIRTPYVCVRSWSDDGKNLILYTRDNWEGPPANPGVWSVEILN